MKAIAIENVGIPAPRVDFLAAIMSRYRRMIMLHRAVPRRSPEIYGVTEAEFDGLEAKIGTGDEAAASELLDRIHPTVLKRVRACLPKESEEDNLVTSVLHRVLVEMRGRIKGVPLSVWISRVTVDECLSQATGFRLEGWCSLADLTLAEESVLEDSRGPDAPIPSASLDLLSKLTASLSLRRRLIVQLLAFEGLSVREVSRTTGWSRCRVVLEAYIANARVRREISMMLMEKGLR